MTQENTDFDDELFILFVKPVLIALAIGFTFLFLLSWYEHTQRKKSSINKFNHLTAFLTEHGSSVKITGIQDEFTQHKGKFITTYNQLWYLCEFSDRYVIEIPRNHNGSTSRVPQLGEIWELRIYSRQEDFWPPDPRLYLYRKID